MCPSVLGDRCTALLGMANYILEVHVGLNSFHTCGPVVRHLATLKPICTTVYFMRGVAHGLFLMTSLDLVPTPEYLGSYTGITFTFGGGGGSAVQTSPTFPLPGTFSEPLAVFLQGTDHVQRGLSQARSLT